MWALHPGNPIGEYAIEDGDLVCAAGRHPITGEQVADALTRQDARRAEAKERAPRRARNQQRRVQAEANARATLKLRTKEKKAHAETASAKTQADVEARRRAREEAERRLVAQGGRQTPFTEAEITQMFREWDRSSRIGREEQLWGQGIHGKS